MSQQLDTCQFSLAWRGACGKPVVAAGRCAIHAQVFCQSCGEPASGECCHTFTQFVCGAPLCGKCEDDGHGHHRRKSEFDTPTFPNGPDGLPY